MYHIRAHKTCQHINSRIQKAHTKVDSLSLSIRQVQANCPLAISKAYTLKAPQQLELHFFTASGYIPTRKLVPTICPTKDLALSWCHIRVYFHHARKLVSRHQASLAVQHSLFLIHSLICYIPHQNTPFPPSLTSPPSIKHGMSYTTKSSFSSSTTMFFYNLPGKHIYT